MGSKKSSLAKAAGVKSAVIHNGIVTLTSFGKGNDAVIEKDIEGRKIIDINIPHKFDARFSEQKGKLAVNGTIVKNALFDLPYSSKTGADRLCAKEQLEKMFFGMEYTDNNLYIQIAYNILDIKKILSGYINNAVFALNNLRRLDGADRENDYIGYLYTANKYEDLVNNCNRCRYRNDVNYKCSLSNGENACVAFNSNICKTTKAYRAFIERIRPYAPYFADYFYTDNTKTVDINGKKTKRNEYRSDKDLYNILRVISSIRQACVHDNTSTRGFLFRSLKTNGDLELSELADRLYDEKVKQVHKNFLSNNKKNMKILCDIFGAKTDDEIKRYALKFYDFVVFKQEKNLGFSVKKLREEIILNEKFPVSDERFGKSYLLLSNKRFDSVRSKLYCLFDFILYVFTENSSFQNKIVENLRAVTSEEDKSGIYKDFAKTAYEACSDKLCTLVDMINGKAIRNTEGVIINGEWFDSSIKAKSAENDFCKIIYILTLFLDGKEINELISRLINKFENIASFIDVADKLKLKVEFCDEYKSIIKSADIAKELRYMKSFVRMQKEVLSISKGIYHDAADVLGVDQSIVGDIVDIDENTSVEEKIDKMVDSLFLSSDHNLRNFIINNVVESRRFVYVVRYLNPKRARALASNTELVSFVLSQQPKAQIDRYFISVTGDKRYNVSDEEKIKTLAQKISTINFMQFSGVVQNARPRSAENLAKEKMKAVIGLYLSVVYNLIKNLVNVNSRYSIAINSLERDTQLHGCHSYKDAPYELTEKFFENGWVRDELYLSAYGKKPVRLTPEQFGEYVQKASFVNYRNMIAHLSVITDAYKYLSGNSPNGIKKITSYYQLYHSIMQRLIANQHNYNERKGYGEGMSEKTRSFYEAAVRSGSYTKDWVKVLNYPFAYNLSRYKNLSNEKFFEGED